MASTFTELRGGSTAANVRAEPDVDEWAVVSQAATLHSVANDSVQLTQAQAYEAAYRLVWLYMDREPDPDAVFSAGEARGA